MIQKSNEKENAENRKEKKIMKNKAK